MQNVYVVTEIIDGITEIGNEVYSSLQKAEEMRRACIFETGETFTEEEMEGKHADMWFYQQDSPNFLYNPTLDLYYAAHSSYYECFIEEMVVIE